MAIGIKETKGGIINRQFDLKSKTKHILLVTSEFPPLPGGIGNHALNLALFLSTKGYDVEVLADQRTLDPEEQKFDEKLDFKVHRTLLKKARILMYLNRIRSVFQLIKDKGVVMASGKFPLWAVAFVSLFYNRKFIAVIHGSEVNFRNPVLKRSIAWSLKRFNKVIAVSNYTESLVADLNLKSVVVIPNGFNASDWRYDTNNQANLKGNPALITVGNVTQRKGQLNVIRHLPEALNIYPNLHYHMVGLPTEKDECLKVAKQIGVEDCISFHGRVKHEDLQAFLNASDVFVMLSSPTASGDVEGFGIAVLEANYVGLPAIGAMGCGIEDAIDNNSSGILIDHDNTDQFINALNAIIGNKDQFSKQAIQWAAKHQWDKIIELYIDQIEGV